MDFKKKYLKYKYKYLKLKQSGGAPSRAIKKEIEDLKENKDIRVIDWNEQDSKLTVTLDRDYLEFNLNDEYPFSAPSLSVNGNRYSLKLLLPFWDPEKKKRIESIIENFIERGKNPQKFDQELKDKIAAKERSNNDRKIAANLQEEEFGASKEDQQVLETQFQTMKLENERKKIKKERKDSIFKKLTDRLSKNYDISKITIEDYSFILETRGRMHYPLNLKIELLEIPYKVLLTNNNNNNTKELMLKDIKTFLDNTANRRELWEPIQVSTKK